MICLKKRLRKITISYLLISTLLVTLSIQNQVVQQFREVALKPVSSVSPADFVIDGFGNGHGRGMGQWGALGMAILQSDTWSQIVDYYYSNTTTATIIESSIRVLLQSTVGAPIEITSSKSFSVSGASENPGVVIQLEYNPSSNNWSFSTSTSCTSTNWSSQGTLATPQISSSYVSGDPNSDLLEVCENGSLVPYRGTISAVVNSSNQGVAVNTLPISSYLDSVVPGEMPAYWGTLGGNGPSGEPWGFQALEAQAVAARSYALASPGRFGIADICDSTQCQHYGGANEENNLTNLAVSDTSGQVQEFSGGAIASTEFSASTGGYTAGGTFPAVPDPGDSICIQGACNPLHSWSITVSSTELENAYPSIGVPSAIVVTQRNGFGTFGGRVLQVVVSGSTGEVTTTGNGLAASLGLYSNWFGVQEVSGNTNGYVIASSQGSIYNFDSSGMVENQGQGMNVVCLVTTFDGGGYWVVYSNGLAQGFGDAPTYLAPAPHALDGAQIVAGATGGFGLWLISSVGQVIADGGAPPLVSYGYTRLSSAPVAFVANGPVGAWVVMANGQIFNLGVSPILQGLSTSQLAGDTVVAGVKPESMNGLWIVTKSGKVFSLGGAQSFGSLSSLGISGTVVAMASSGDGGGYELVLSTGAIIPFGDAPFFGDLVALGISQPGSIVAIATLLVNSPAIATLPSPGKCGMKWGIITNRFNICLPWLEAIPSSTASGRLVNWGISGIGFTRARFIK